MSACSVCSTSGHNKMIHAVKCIICGGEYQYAKPIETLNDREDLRVFKENYRCTNEDFHKVIRNAWSLKQDEVKRLTDPIKP